MDEVLRRLGGLAAASALRRAGVDRSAIERAVQAGDLVRPRRGWYAAPWAAPELVTAVRVGGRLGCVSALRRHGVWTLPHPGIHVTAARGVDIRRAAGIRVHWTDDRGGRAAIDPPAAALATAMTCLDPMAATVAADSALHLGLVSLAQLETMGADSPRVRRVCELVDPASESGLETVARLHLRRLRIRTRSQVVVPGIGRVDLLIGDRLVLELDGEAFHDFDRDRDRDRALITAGFVVIRVSYRQVLDDWATVERQILTLVRRRDHLWRANSHA